MAESLGIDLNNNFSNSLNNLSYIWLEVDGYVRVTHEVNYLKNGKIKNDEWKIDNGYKVPSFYDISFFEQIKLLIPDKKTVYIVENENSVELLKAINELGLAPYPEYSKIYESELEILKDLDIVIIPNVDGNSLFKKPLIDSFINSKYPNSVKIIDLKPLINELDSLINRKSEVTSLSDYIKQYRNYLIFKSQIEDSDNEAEKQKQLKEVFEEKIQNKLNDLEISKEAYFSKLKLDSIDLDSFFKSYTPNEIMNMEFPPMEWLVEDLIPAKGLIQLAGKPKTGKSLMCLGLAYAKATGTSFLGKRVKKGKVLYLDLENSERVVKERLVKLNPDKKSIDNIIFNFYDPTNGAIPSISQNENNFIEILEKLVSVINDIELIVIDTWGHIKSADKTDPNGEMRETKALADFTRKHDLGMILIGHCKKMKEEDPFDNSLGSQGINSQLDTMMVLTHSNDLNTGQAQDHILHIKGREIEEEHYKLEQVFPRWKLKGTVDELELEREIEEFKNNEYYQAVEYGFKILGKDRIEVTSSEIKKYLAELKGIPEEQIGKKIKRITTDIKGMAEKFKKLTNIYYDSKQEGKNATIHLFERVPERNII